MFSQNGMLESLSFNPVPGKYIVSGWVKEEKSTIVSSYTNSSINFVSFKTTTGAPIDPDPINNGVLYEFKGSGTIIDGWQRILGIIEILPPSNNEFLTSLSIELICNNPDGDCYFDDIRFYPYNGNMKSFVYDEDTQRLMAELDENNYASFYEYDLEGGLVRVKKETERGVFTIQETRSNNQKNKN